MLFTQKNQCCGCGACVAVCPKQCIKMKEDKNGFVYPNVDEQICINCGLCNQSCPIQMNIEQKSYMVKAFMSYNLDDKKREMSSSGGVFFELANNIIDASGVVYGVVIDKDLNVIHKRASSIEEVYPMLGSKYVQSIIGKTYEQVAHDLKLGLCVLFSGTPCQIAGLYSYLNTKKISLLDKLITVDTICHGVPSRKVMCAYVKEFEDQCGEKVNSIAFRDKCTGWENYSVTMQTNNYEFACVANSDNYMLAFRRNLSLRDSCYCCRFKLGNHIVFADITLGDFWGVGREYDEFLNDDKGVSWITVHTEKGKHLIDSVVNNLYCKEIKIEIPLRNNMSATFPATMNMKRRAFFVALDKSSEFSKVVLKYAGETGLIGFMRRIKRNIEKCVKK
ncbi:MAG: Coenzyme F420 hydrogenase/dehydrogenase, beta subunit C-terminal domain [Oscillospiraceae bacterium]